jgi:hypothetical protein
LRRANTRREVDASSKMPKIAQLARSLHCSEGGPAAFHRLRCRFEKTQARSDARDVRSRQKCAHAACAPFAQTKTPRLRAAFACQAG